MAQSRLQVDPLFQGLTRPPMVLGVSYLFFVINGTITLLSIINTQNFVVLMVIAPFVHGVGYMICLREPRAIELAVLRYAKCWRCRNRKYHSYTNSYDLF